MRATTASDPDRDVDVEDPVPGDVLGDHAAEQRPDRERHRRDAGPDADRRAALACREGGADDRERRGHHQRRADALHRARARSARSRWREAAEASDEAVKIDEADHEDQASSVAGRRACRR